jgi:DNA gyrase subunit A
MTAIDYIEDESLIPEENIMITMTHNGYIKRNVADTFKAQNRGGVGVKGITTNEEDFVEHIINLSTHDYVLFFTNKGKVYRLKGYEIPEFGRTSKGLPIINLLQIDKDEMISSIIKIEKDDAAKYLLFVTKSGIVKKTDIAEYDNIRANGKICITLRENDELIAVKKSNGENIVLLGASNGRMVKFNESEIRSMGRTSTGVKGIELDGATCIGAEVSSEDDEVLIVTTKGYGKKTNVREFRETKRGSKGVKALNLTEKNGDLSTFKIVGDKNDAVIVTNSGMVIRLPLTQISTLGRVTQGVRLINLKDDQLVSTLSLIDADEESNESEAESIDNDALSNDTIENNISDNEL